MGDPPAVDDEHAAALDAHAGAAEGLAHLRQRTGAVLERYGEVLHSLPSACSMTGSTVIRVVRLFEM